MVACRGMKIDPYPPACTQHNFKYNKDLSIWSDILNLINGKVGKNLELIGTEKDFLENTNNTSTKINN